MAIPRRSLAALAALTLAIGAAVFAGAPAQADPGSTDPIPGDPGGGGGAPPVDIKTILFSAGGVGFGEQVTYTVTTTSSVRVCGYANGPLAPDFDFTTASSTTRGPYNWNYFSAVYPGVTQMNFYLISGSAPSCPAQEADVLVIASASTGLTIGGAPTPSPTPTIDPTPVVPAPVEPTLAVTGQDAAGPLGLVGLLLAAGFGALTVRRRTAKS